MSVECSKFLTSGSFDSVRLQSSGQRSHSNLVTDDDVVFCSVLRQLV